MVSKVRKFWLCVFSGVVATTLIGVATFFFFFFFFLESGLKLDEKSIENGLEGQKFLVVCLSWGGCPTLIGQNLRGINFRTLQELVTN